MSEHSDLTSHHIEGFARAVLECGVDAHFRVPLISHIDGNLWMGGCLPGVTLDPSYRYVVSLYPWERYDAPTAQRMEVRLYDSAEVPARAQLDAITNSVARMVTDGKTLVHCQAGLNRSGLICALVLVKRGRTPAEAIDLLRQKRHPLVLCNEAFERFLLDPEAAAREPCPMTDCDLVCGPRDCRCKPCKCARCRARAHRAAAPRLMPPAAGAAARLFDPVSGTPT